jgi:hypothetical protein
MNFKRLSVGILITLIVGATLAFIKPDDELVTKIIAQLDKWRAEHPQEKVYLHFDKPYYAIGEDIWFKAYVTIGSEHKLSAYSQTLNVDLIDDNDSVKRSLKLPLTAGLAAGDFALADSMAEGNYRIRAYTNWMRNEGEAYFFDKTITVVNGISNKVFTKTAYTYSTLNGKQKVTAVITYTDLNGIAYVNKPVSYEVEINGKSISKGKGITDDKGNLTASFTNNLPVSITSGHINTEVKLDDKRTVTKAIPIKTLSNKVDVQFFPESGNLINGVFEKVAFKAVGADGLGVDIKGFIADDQNNQISALGESHFGMGTVNFEPESGKTYKAHITYPDGSEYIFDLPKAVDNGYVLSINSMRDDKVYVSILPGKNSGSSTPSLSGLTLIAQAGGEICYAGKSKDGATSFSAAIDKNKFPSGIIQFTLFSATGDPLNERLIFVQNPDQLKLAVTTEKQSYKPREKVTINLNAKTSEDKPIVGSFSASVIDESKVTTDEANEISIFSTLLLTSDLRGYIEKPNYYFTNVSNETKANLDVLMLTQGYHRFEWKQLLVDKFTSIVFKPERSLEVTGHLKTFGGKPVPNGKVTLFSTSGGTFIIDTVADANGKFTFKDLVFRDSIKFVIQARTAKDRKNLDITLDNVTPQPVGPNKNVPDLQVNINDGASAYLLNSKKLYDEQVKYGIGNHTIVLKEVVIREKRENPFKNSANLNGAGNADQTLTSKDLMYGGGMLSQVLQGRLNFVTFRNGIPYSTRSPNTPMQIVLDGTYVEPDFLDNLTPSDVATVEVLRTIGNTAIYGSRGGGGVLVITTKRGGETVYNKYAPGIVTYAPKGYYRAREFYSPKYDDPKTNTQMQDLRSTIYWAPGLLTDKDGNTSLSFFNADAKGMYRVIIEGIDAEGNLGRQVYRYKVE